MTVDTDHLNSHHKFVENLLTSHARCLLAEYRLRDLGTFAAHIASEDFQLLRWLKKCGSEDLVIDDFVQVVVVFVVRDGIHSVADYNSTLIGVVVVVVVVVVVRIFTMG